MPEGVPTSMLLSLSGVRDTFIVALDLISSSNSWTAASSCEKDEKISAWKIY